MVVLEGALVSYIVYSLLGSLFLTSEALGLTQRLPHNSITGVILSVCVAMFEGAGPVLPISTNMYEGYHQPPPAAAASLG